eukprot:6028321-Alexandrium_andersonii.AAC.1
MAQPPLMSTSSLIGRRVYSFKESSFGCRRMSASCSPSNVSASRLTSADAMAVSALAGGGGRMPVCSKVSISSATGGCSAAAAGA